ncbi:MAG: carbohydrate kinase [Actinobacteria bacterium]|nr:carbohydrate kinase [Actinomycetota bacterium]
MNKKLKIIGLGEILWDMLPEGKKLGGAPANFAYYVSKLGQIGIITSRVGNDSLGKEILESMEKLNLNNKYIQIDPNYPTSTVSVKLDSNGQPDYVIHQNVAWDSLDFNESWKHLAKEADVICFGTLAQRSNKSKNTIFDFLKSARPETIRLLDINIRQNFYSIEVIEESIKLSNILKLNINELKIIRNLFNYSNNKNEIDLCLEIINDFKLDLLCLTKGEKGSIVLNSKEYYEHQGYKVSIVDTVGAGDAFAAAMIVQYIKDKTLKEISDLANRLGSWVSSQSGPTPELSHELVGVF